LQFLLIWFVPFLGALTSHLILYGIKARPRKPDKDFIPEQNVMS